jgi:hypothetical protein
MATVVVLKLARLCVTLLGGIVNLKATIVLVGSERTKGFFQMALQLAPNSIKPHAMDLDRIWTFLVQLRAWNLIYHCRHSIY